MYIWQIAYSTYKKCGVDELNIQISRKLGISLKKHFRRGKGTTTKGGEFFVIVDGLFLLHI
jgi:hypothetical protein